MKKYILKMMMLSMMVIMVACGKNGDKDVKMENKKQKQNENESIAEKPKNQYVTDKGKVYYDGKVVKGAKTDTFEWIEGTWYGKDENNVYFEGKKIGKLEGKPIERINNYLVRSGNVLYYFYWKIDNLKNSKMEIIANKEDGAEYYIKDGKNVYFLERNINFPEFDGKLILLRNIDYNGFEVVGNVYDVSYYLKDRDKVYFLNEVSELSVVEKADSKTFALINDLYSKDKNNIFCNGKILEGADVKSFKVFYDSDVETAKDSKHGYYDCYSVR